MNMGASLDEHNGLAYAELLAHLHHEALEAEHWVHSARPVLRTIIKTQATEAGTGNTSAIKTRL
jgi:hypothetical protein